MNTNEFWNWKIDLKRFYLLQKVRTSSGKQVTKSIQTSTRVLKQNN